MDPIKPSAAAATTRTSISDADLAATTRTSTSDADLASYLRSMRLGQQDVQMLLRQEQRYAAMFRPTAPASPPSREQQQEQRYAAMFRPTAPASPLAAFQVMTNSMMQELQTARQFWPYHSSAQSCSQPQAGPWSSAQQQQRCTLSQYQTQAAVTMSQYQPQAAVAASQYQTQAAVAASQYQTQAAVTASQYQQSGDAPDYGSSFYQRMRAIEAAEAQLMPSRERRCRTLEETRSALLSGAPMELQLVTFPDSAAHVVHLLLQNDAEDYERIRQSVLAGVTRRVYDFIDNEEGHEVLVALLRACAGRHAEVDAIVQAAVAPRPNGRHSLLRSTKHDYWENSVKELMTAASPYPDLVTKLVNRLMAEGLLLNERGDQLLHHCFATARHEDTPIVVECALKKIDFMIPKSYGSKCLVECYDRATGHQLRAFHDILLNRALEISTGKFSNYFMQHVLEHADGETRQRLVERLMENVVELSLNPIGSYVVEACYQKAGLLPLVLEAFLRLDNACLVQLVQGASANYVVHKLLSTAIDAYPMETMVLMRRIGSLPQEVLNQGYAKKVMKVVSKLFIRYRGSC